MNKKGLKYFLLTTLLLSLPIIQGCEFYVYDGGSWHDSSDTWDRDHDSWPSRDDSGPTRERGDSGPTRERGDDHSGGNPTRERGDSGNPTRVRGGAHFELNAFEITPAPAGSSGETKNNDSASLLARDYNISRASAEKLLQLINSQNRTLLIKDLNLSKKEFDSLSGLKIPSLETIQKVAVALNEDEVKIECLIKDFISDIKILQTKRQEEELRKQLYQN